MRIVPAADSMRRARPTVLVIDGERGSREALRMILAPSRGVVAASTESEALAAFDGQSIEVVTLDLDLPGGRSGHFLHTIRERHPDVPVVAITARAAFEDAVLALREGVSELIEKPFDVTRVRAVIDRAIARRAELAEQRAQQCHGGEESLVRLVEVAEAQGLVPPGHGRRVGSYAALLARYAGLDETTCDRVRMAGILHDVGKIGVGRALAGGAAGRALHALAGTRLAAPLGVSNAVADAIRHHHERFDGCGEPARLAREAIPLAARIVAVADAWDELTAPARAYFGLARGEDAVRVGPEAASLELLARAGRQLDPDLVTHFLAGVRAGECDLEADATLWWVDDRRSRSVVPGLADALEPMARAARP